MSNDTRPVHYRNGRNYSGYTSGGGGGHTILNESGTEMTQRSKLKFMGCDVTDDAENNTTVVAGFDKTANQTLSGNVTFTKRPLVDISGTALTAQTAANILSFKYKSSVSKEKTVNVIRTYGDAENGANNGTVIIGSSSGQTVISSGESAPNVMKTLSEFDNTNEKIYAMSDSGIDIYTNCNTAANAIKAIAIAANGAITLATNAITSLKNALGIGTTDISSAGATLTGAYKGNLIANYNSTDIPFKFGIDANGNYGYIKAGADTVTPFKKGNISFEFIWDNSFFGDLSRTVTIASKYDAAIIILVGGNDNSNFHATISGNITNTPSSRNVDTINGNTHYYQQSKTAYVLNPNHQSISISLSARWWVYGCVLGIIIS